MTRIRLRPYHPTYLVAYYGDDSPADGFARIGFNEIIAKVREAPDDIEIELVGEYDDVCMKCERRVKNDEGSVWGTDSSCPSSDDPQVVRKVDQTNREFLETMGLEFGSVIRLRDLVPLLAERIPVLYTGTLGGTEFQDRYEKGLAAFRELWGPGS